MALGQSELLRRLALSAGLIGLAGCSSLLPKPAAPMVVYAIDIAGAAITTATPPAAPAAAPPAARPTLLVQVLHAAPGFDSSRLVYMRQPHRIEWYSQSEWVDTPARMLAPLVVAAVERSGGFAAVAMAPSAAASDLRLDVELLHLAQSFTSQPSQPSQVRLALRATLVDSSRRILATRVIEASAGATSEDAPGGVLAANQAAQQALQALAEFCRQVAANAALATPQAALPIKPLTTLPTTPLASPLPTRRP